MWPITNLGTASRKKHKYSSFFRSGNGVKKVRFYTSTKTAHHCVLMFFTETIHLLVEHTDVYYQ